MNRAGKPLRDYHINVFWSEEDGCYVTDVPDLAHCSAFGSSPQEAVAELVIAKEAWLEAAREQEKPIPAPLYRPAIYQVAG